MERAELARRLGDLFGEWVDDPDSDVVAAELVEGRWAVRMAQQTRDFTTVWVTPGDRTVSFEVYVLPAPPRRVAEVYRQLLFRNRSAWRVHFAIDRDGEIYLVGRVDVAQATEETIQYVFAEIYGLVDLSFRPLLRAGFSR
ncbi:MAG: YbjN domain-containing protein [bacterium]|nr:YbjN domain-containing protein [bacterium]MDE0288692.1 YbjN domain-containing protein [bacterium]MDE0439624.1 YbjN domain-containing protein [bacterium]